MPSSSDDGLIATEVLSVEDGIASLLVQRVSTKKSTLKAEKGINFPDSHLLLPSLTKKDIEILPFVCEHADLIGYSFVRRAADIMQLQDEIDFNNGKGSIILKIETPEAVENLPSLLLQGMQRPAFGAGLLGWIAGDMVVTDVVTKEWVNMQAQYLHWVAPATAAVLVILVGKVMAARQQAKVKPIIDLVDDTTPKQ